MRRREQRVPDQVDTKQIGFEIAWLSGIKCRFKRFGHRNPARSGRLIIKERGCSLENISTGNANTGDKRGE